MKLDPEIKARRKAEREAENAKKQNMQRAEIEERKQKRLFRSQPEVEKQDTTEKNTTMEENALKIESAEQTANPINTTEIPAAETTDSTISTPAATEVKKDTTNTKKYNPLQGNAHERAHSTPIVNTKIEAEIPEADYVLPQIDESNIEASLSSKNQNLGGLLPGMDDTKTQNPANPANPSTPPTLLPSNPATNSMTPEEQLLAAQQMADTIIGGYDKLHAFGRFMIKPDEQALIIKQREDKIDLSMQLPININKKTGVVTNMTLGEWTHELNKEIDSELILTNDFKTAVRPALIRTCMKHGWLLSDDNYILYKFGEDFATKVSMCVGFKKSLNKFYKMFELAHEENKKIIKDNAQSAIDAQVAIETARIKGEFDFKLKAAEEAAQKAATVIPSATAQNAEPAKDKEESKIAA